MSHLYFTTTGSLNTAGISLYANAMLWDKVADLPKEFEAAIAQNPVVKKQIIRIYHVLKKEKKRNNALQLPAYFKQIMISNDASIDRLLAQFLSLDVCEPYAIYEEEIQGVLMSDTSFKLHSPKDAAYVKNNLLFAWEGTMEQLNLIIENNDLDLILNDTIQNNKTLTLTISDFPDGLYYYKLIYNNEMIKLGKFYVFRGA